MTGANHNARVRQARQQISAEANNGGPYQKLSKKHSKDESVNLTNFRQIEIKMTNSSQLYGADFWVLSFLEYPNIRVPY
jgi:hypothetical protein